jgi:ferredoxin/uncharacterized protein (DUF3820 family)
MSQNTEDEFHNQVKYAIDENGDIHTAEKDDAHAIYPFKKLSCVQCKTKVCFRKKHTRKLSGLDIPVRAHFAHVSKIECQGESHAHIAAKLAVQKYHSEIQFTNTCKICNSAYDIDVGLTTGATCHLEYNLAESNIRPDVAVVQNGRCVGIVEVYHTHAVDETKLAKLTSLGMAWVEVEAQAILKWLETRQGKIEIYRCQYGRMCGKCHVLKMDEARVEQIQERIAKKKRTLDELHAVEEQRVKLLKVCQDVNDLGTEFSSTLVPELRACCASGDFDKLRNININLTRVAKKLSAVLSAHKHVGWDKGAEAYTTNSDSSFFMRWGKYKGKTLEEIFEEDPAYIFWLKTKELPVEAHTEVCELTRGVCEDCHENTGYSEAWKTKCKNCFRNSR